MALQLSLSANGLVSADEKPEATFTVFPKLPYEIKDMIWDEALGAAEIKIIHLRNGFRSQADDHVTFNPINVALSCREAAERWTKLYPLHKVKVDDPYYPADEQGRIVPIVRTIKMRFDKNRTVFLVTDGDISDRETWPIDHLGALTRQASCADSFNIAKSLQAICYMDPCSFLHDTRYDYGELYPQGLRVHPQRLHAIKRMFKFCRDNTEMMPQLADILVRMMEHPEEGNDADYRQWDKPGEWNKHWMQEVFADQFPLPMFAIPECPEAE